jgi:putative addiction module component (TIGR02574 family)
MGKQELLDSARTLPKDERIELVMELWESIDADDQPISDELRGELDRRAAADDLDPAPAEDWDQLKAKLLRGDI